MQQLFCNHKYIKSGNNLYCEHCGKHKRMRCDHKWKVHSEQKVNTFKDNTQTQQILICTECGELKSVNLTTGIIGT